MPYDKIDDLPEGIRDALPTEAAKIWMKAFNGAYDGDDKKAASAAWAAVKNAGWMKGEDGKWTKTVDNTEDHEFEIFSVGTWNGDKYNEQDLDDMVAAYAALKDQIKPPLKLGHKDKKAIEDGQPALGWVASLKRVGGKLVATVRDMPKLLKDAIAKGLYKRVSSEIYWNLKIGDKTYRRVLSAVALLGASIPAVSNLKDLEVFLSRDLQDATFGDVKAYSFEIDSSHIMEVQDMDAEVIKKEYEQKLKESEDARKASEDKLRAYETERLVKVKTDRETEFKAFIEQKVKDGFISPAQRDVIVAKHAYSDEAGVTIAFADFREYVEKGGKLIEFSEKGQQNKGGGKDKKTYKTVHEEVDAKVKEYMTANATTKVSYQDSVLAVLGADEDLAARYFGATPKVSDDE